MNRNTYLVHYGTKGMHWGERLYQYPDGSLTPLGRARYGNKTNWNRVQAAKRSAAYKKRMEEAAKKKARTDAEVAKIKTTKSEREEAKKAENAEKPKAAEEAKREPSELKKRNLEDLTDEELDILIKHQKKISELKAELDRNKEPDPRQIAIAEAKIQQEYLKYFPPEEQKDGAIKTIVKTAAKDVVAPFLVSVGKEALSRYGTQVLNEAFKDPKKEAAEKKKKAMEDKYNQVKKETEIYQMLADQLKYQYIVKSTSKEAFKVGLPKDAKGISISDADLEVLNRIRRKEMEKVSGKTEKKAETEVKHTDIGPVEDENELYHHGILGQKWGIRRFQNPDGTLTPKGRAHYKKTLTVLERNSVDARGSAMRNYKKYNETHIKRYKKQAEKDMKLSKKLDQSILQAIAQAVNDNNDVYMSRVIGSDSKAHAEQIISYALAGPIGMGAVNMKYSKDYRFLDRSWDHAFDNGVTIQQNPMRIASNSYKVKRNRKGNVGHLKVSNTFNPYKHR